MGRRDTEEVEIEEDDQIFDKNNRRFAKRQVDHPSGLLFVKRQMAPGRRSETKSQEEP